MSSDFTQDDVNISNDSTIQAISLKAQRTTDDISVPQEDWKEIVNQFNVLKKNIPWYIELTLFLGPFLLSIFISLSISELNKPDGSKGLLALYIIVCFLFIFLYVYFKFFWSDKERITAINTIQVKIDDINNDQKNLTNVEVTRN